MKFGRVRPLVARPTLKLSNYLSTVTLPPVPASCDFTSPALPALRDVLGNDRVGDCVLAAGAHLVALATANAGFPVHPTTAEVLAQYSAITGYSPTDPSSDRGTNVSDAFAFWINHGFTNGTRALGSIGITCENVQEVRAAMWLFENLIFGIELPDAWINPFPSSDGFVWDVGTPNPAQGHCVLGVGFNSLGVQVDSWGLFGTITYAAIASLCASRNGGELHAILTPDILIRGSQKAPSGFAWRDLIADFDALGGTVALPPLPVAPTPIPKPIPTPSTSVSLAQVELWLAQGINRGLPLVTRNQAIVLANAELSRNWPKS